MKIAQAIPHIFTRTYPVLEKGTQLLLVASLLRFHQIDAIPIGFKKRQKKHLAVFGYSCLSKLLESDPSWFKAFLTQPCEDAASELASISSDAEIEDLLELFDKTRFGFAMVEGEYELGALVSLRDLLGLYNKNVLSSTLTLNDIASPIFSMSGDSSLREALTEMFARRFRRIFLEGREYEAITDRRIISYIFSSSRLNELAQTEKDVLKAPISRLDATSAKWLSGRTKAKFAARSMMEQIEECLVCEKGVVTPWDVTMKPWKMGKLAVK